MDEKILNLLTKMQTQMEEMQTKMDAMQADISELKTGQARIETKVDALETNLERTTREVAAELATSIEVLGKGLSEVKDVSAQNLFDVTILKKKVC